jgi:hypothetical protein
MNNLHPARKSTELRTYFATMTASNVARAIGKLQPKTTTFLLCDIQERFRDVIWHFPQVSMIDVSRGGESQK